MNIYMLSAIAVILAYLTGSVPTSVWVGKMFHGIDVREHGSGNAGATNTMRVLGVKTGIPVLLFDIFKGWLSVKYVVILNIFIQQPENFIRLSILLGVAAVLGHIFPVYAGFRGGKGVATIFGVLLALAPYATLCAAGIFLFFLFVTGFVSVSSMAAGVSFPLWIILVFPQHSPALNIFSIIVAILLLLTHKSNIERLLKGEEKKASFLFRKKKSHT